jgi:hypothetical protein
MTNQHDSCTAPAQRQKVTEPTFSDFIGAILAHIGQPTTPAHPSQRIKTSSLPTVPLHSVDYERMAHELPLIGRLISVHALRLLAAIGTRADTGKEQENLLTAALDAKGAVDRLHVAAEALSRRRYPKALWLAGYEKFTGEQDDPFEYLPVLVKIRKGRTGGQGAEHDETI